MPVSKQGRFVTSSPEQLNVWLGRESGKPVHVITPEADLTSGLKRGVAFFRATKKCSAKRSPALRTRAADVSFFAPSTWHCRRFSRALRAGETDIRDQSILLTILSHAQSSADIAV